MPIELIIVTKKSGKLKGNIKIKNKTDYKSIIWSQKQN